MGGMPMPGGGPMLMAWMPMCGQSWIAAEGSFLSAWTPMMAAMMLPSLLAMLWRHRREIGGAGQPSSALLMLPAAAGYFLVWTLLGAAVYPLGAAAGAAAARYEWTAGAAPVALGTALLIAGVLQLTGWKARHLAHCRGEHRREAFGSGRIPRAGMAHAWSHGVRLGLHCSQSCAGLTGVLIVAGVMDTPVMLAVTAAITLERLAPAGERMARLVGVIAVGAGMLLTLRAAGLS